MNNYATFNKESNIYEEMGLHERRETQSQFHSNTINANILTDKEQQKGRVHENLNT